MLNIGNKEVSSMLNKRMVNLINVQIKKELESAYLYLDFANYFSEKGLPGFEHWYRVQAREEIEHAERFIDYLHDENENVKLMSLDKLECVCTEDMDVLKSGLKHEMYITKLINDLYVEAEKLYDLRTMRFLDWFIDEQAEEEKNANELISRYEMFAVKCSSGLYHMDKELGKR